MPSADYICKQFGSRSGPTKCLLITFANSLDLDQARQNVKCNLPTTVWTQIWVYKFLAGSGSKLFDTDGIFLNDLKNKQTDFEK